MSNECHLIGSNKEVQAKLRQTQIQAPICFWPIWICGFLRKIQLFCVLTVTFASAGMKWHAWKHEQE